MVYEFEIEDKKQYKISITPSLKKQFEEWNTFLQHFQKKKKYVGLLGINAIPHPYSIGNEIQARWENYLNLITLTKLLIKDFVPSNEQEKYYVLIPYTPYHKIFIQVGELDYHNVDIKSFILQGPNASIYNALK